MYVTTDMNKQRADIARRALALYIAWNFSIPELDHDLGSIHYEDILASCSDLITNILHFAAQLDTPDSDLDNILPRALANFNDERTGLED